MVRSLPSLSVRKSDGGLGSAAVLTLPVIRAAWPAIPPQCRNSHMIRID